MTNKMRILIRTCARINKMSFRAFNFKNQEELILTCLETLFRSCANSRDRVIINVVDDSSPEHFREKVKNLIKKFNLNGALFPIVGGSYGATYTHCLNIIQKSKEKVYFLCEDDYLFTENAIPAILEAYDSKVIGTDEFAVHPSDYIDRYEKLYPSYIFLSKYCHWRSIGESTGTFIITKKIFKDYKEYFYKHGQEVLEIYSLNKVWAQIPLISPIPSLCTHLNYDTISPFVDWKKYIPEGVDWNRNPKEKMSKDILLKKVKRAIIYFNKKFLHKPYLRGRSSAHLVPYKKLSWNKE